eukprot:g39910.t1
MQFAKPCYQTVIQTSDELFRTCSTPAIALSNTTLTTLSGVHNKNALKIVENNRSRVTELEELCIQGAARIQLMLIFC